MFRLRNGGAQAMMLCLMSGSGQPFSIKADDIFYSVLMGFEKCLLWLKWALKEKEDVA